MSVDQDQRTDGGIYNEKYEWAEYEEPARWATASNDNLEGSEGSLFETWTTPGTKRSRRRAGQGAARLRGQSPYPRTFRVKPGTLKRILGNERVIQQTQDLEAKVYLARTHRARQARRYRTDLLEVYGGEAGVTQRALQRGLRALQPVDAIYGMRLDGRADHVRLRNLILDNKPFLVVYEIACAAWTHIQHLNYSPAQLQALRLEQDQAIGEMVKTIVAAEEEYGGHFLIENPAYTDFWKHPAMLKLSAKNNVTFRVGHMCAFRPRDKDGLLMKKPILDGCPTWRTSWIKLAGHALARRLMVRCSAATASELKSTALSCARRLFMDLNSAYELQGMSDTMLLTQTRMLGWPRP